MTAAEMLEQVAEQLRAVLSDLDHAIGLIEKVEGGEAADNEASAAWSGLDDVITDIERWRLLDPDARNEAKPVSRGNGTTVSVDFADPRIT